jgi:D-aminoacyl-tRNA deacylase
VHNADLFVDNKLVSSIKKGLVVFIGFCIDEDIDKIDWLANKIVNLRIFKDDEDKMNLSVKDVGGDILLVSNFTLYADTSHGFRPNFMYALNSEKARPLYEELIKSLNNLYSGHIQTGIFHEHMEINQQNDGPINIVIDTKEKNSTIININ